MTIRRPSPMALALTAAIVVIAGLTAALIAVATGRHDGDVRNTAATTPASSTATPAAVTVSGAVRMKHYDDTHSQNWRKLGPLNCEGIGGYDDMTEGASVTVYDSTGKVIGAGALTEGLAGDDLCVWSFTIEGVPDAPFYQVEVSHRGKVTVARSEASSVSLSLG